MRYIQYAASLLALTILISCNNMHNDATNGGSGGGNGDPKTYATAAEAAAAAKTDMLSAIDQKVDFGVDKAKLSAANPGTPVMSNDVSWDQLLKADSTADLAKMSVSNNTAIVPLVNNGEVVAVVGLNSENQKFKVSMLGDKRMSTELDMVVKAAGSQDISVYQIDNLSATIYEARSPNGAPMYYTSYNNNSLRQGMSAATLMPMLRAEAEGFQREFGDQIKKEKLAR